MLSQPLLRLASAVSRRRMKLLLGIALLAYVASVWGNLINMRSIQENGELRIESRIEEIIEPLREKIRDLEKSFTQKYPPVKFLSEKDRKRILGAVSEPPDGKPLELEEGVNPAYRQGVGQEE
uniref:Uncharacterized protein n=1 Tax=Ovis aries TaxID=9940 RepID=A0AC11EM01_SHEEP